MPRTEVLIIDDDVELTRLLQEFLSNYEIDCNIANTAKQGLRALKKNAPELIILDVMLPDKLGFDLCREIRNNNPVPIIMLSARGDVYDRILGLELGADDYLPKPFEPRELLARIESVLRRRKDYKQEETLVSGNLKLNLLTEQVFLDGDPVSLTHTEFKCLAYLLKNKHRILNRDQIMGELRGLDWELDNRSIDILISRLRKKLNDDPRAPVYITTVRGSGYRFTGKQ